MKAVELSDRNHVVFNNTKDEAITFKRRRKPELERRIAVARFSPRVYNELERRGHGVARGVPELRTTV